MLGDIALTWEKNNEKYLILLTLKDILKQKIVTLDEKKTQKLGLFKREHSIWRSLFTLDGSKLGISTNWYPSASFIGVSGLINSIDEEINYIDVKSENSLTIAEKAKRLGIAAVAAKKLLKKKNE